MSDILRGIAIRERPGELVVRATDAEVAAFATTGPSDVMLAREHRQASAGVQDYGRWRDLMDTGGMLYNARGVPVAVVTSMSVSMDPIETTGFGDAMRGFLSGPRRIELRVEALGA